jgi:stress-induced morphogen
MAHSASSLEAALRERLQATHVTVVDTSDGCGSKFAVTVLAPCFDGKTLLARHRLVNEALKEELKSIHALTITKAAVS